MQRPLHNARHARPEAIMARSGMGPSCAVEPGAPRGGFTAAGAVTGAAWTKIGLGTPEIVGHLSGWARQDRRDGYGRRGRTVARP